MWERSYRLSIEVVRAAEGFTGIARYPLANQIVRSAISIPSNIAEGSGRGSAREFGPFLAIALGSAYELDTQIRLARDLHLISSNDATPCIDEIDGIQRMLRRLRTNTAP